MKQTIPFDDYNQIIPPPERRYYVGTITTNWGHRALRAGWKLIEIYETEDIPDRENMEE